MHSGITKTFKKLNYIILIALATIGSVSCKDKKKNKQYDELYPQNGSSFKLGENIPMRFVTEETPDSVQFYMDDTFLLSQKDTSTLSIATDKWSVGNRTITAKIFRKGASTEISSNILLLSAKIPVQYGYQIVKTYQHDVSSYTQGLEFHDGIFYESDGEYGGSSIRRVAQDGKVLKQVNLDKKYFAEGMTVVGNKILMLTYREKVMFEYDKNTLELLKTYPYNHADEGWGLAFDGKQTIYNSDGTNRLFKLNKNTYQPEGFVEVYDDKGPVNELNELEWIDGKIYANIYTSDLIAIINPESGEVEAYINLMGLRKDEVEDESQDVLNGIAWDAQGKRLFVTGKKWPKLYEITLKEH